MKTITEQDIINKGLDYVRQFVEFRIVGNHYYPYPKILDQLNYNVKTEYHGNSDQGSAVSVFTQKSAKQIEQEDFDKSLDLQIKAIEKKFNVKLKIVE